MATLRMKRLIVVAAVVLMLMMVLPRGGSALEVSMSPLAECTPDCTGMANGDKVADPQNCTNYYYCINGQPAEHPNSCGNNSHFEVTENDCRPGEECSSVCGPGGTGCAITCNDTTVMVANPFDCFTYYFCTPGHPELRNCTQDFPNFDGRGCTNDPSVCCPPYCNAYCDGSGFAMVPDPDDCKSFYVCDEKEGPPTDDFHFTCSAGQYFNIALGNCESDNGISCTNLCDAASGTTTTTSTTTTSTTTTSSGGGGGSSNGPTDGGGTTTTTTTTTTGDCVSSFTCPAEGFFPACQTCQPEYFNCDGAGVAGVLDTCSDGTVFNPTPDYGFCLLPSNCPYP